MRDRPDAKRFDLHNEPDYEPLQECDLRFKEMPPQNHTLDFLKLGLSDLTSLQLIEIKDFVLDNVFYDLKDVVTQCTTSYYAQLIK